MHSLASEQVQTQAGGSRYSSPPLIKGLRNILEESSPVRGSASQSLIIKKHTPYIFEMEEAANEQYNIEINKEAERRNDTFGDYNEDMSKARSASLWNSEQARMNYLRVSDQPHGRSNSRSVNDTLDKSTAQPDSREYIKLDLSQIPSSYLPSGQISQTVLRRAHQLLPYAMIDKAKNSKEGMTVEDVLYEGEMMKYKPGLKISYIDRWGQLTKREFRYFKNNWTANCWLSRPLIVIPFRNIAAVRKVKVMVHEDQDLRREHGKLYQFEIFTKYDSEYQTYHQLNTSYAVPFSDTASSYLPEQSAPKPYRKSMFQSARRTHSPELLTPQVKKQKRRGAARSNSPYTPSVNVSRSFVGASYDSLSFEDVVDKWGPHLSMSFATPARKVSLDRGRKVKIVEKSHLMASPSRLKSPNVARVSRVMSPHRSSPESHCPTPSVQESHKISNANFSKSGLLGIPPSDFSGPISNFEVTSSHMAPSSVVLRSEIEEVNVKSPSAWIQSTAGKETSHPLGAATWSNREIEWYYAEKRYLFATRTSQERDRWVASVAAIIDYHQQKAS